MNSINLKEILNIDNVIVSNAKQNKNMNILISPSVYENINVLYYKMELLKVFSKFKSSRYFYESVSSSTNFDLTGVKSNALSKPVENKAGNIVDQQIFSKNFYKSLVLLSDKLTYEESIYLVKTFLDSSSEEKIAEILHFSKTALQKYKKSCLIKMWVDLKKYVEE